MPPIERGEFRRPDTHSTFEIEAYLEQVPASARVRALAARNTSRRCVEPLPESAWLQSMGPFEWIPLRTYLAVAFAAGCQSHPELPSLEATRRHARGIYPTFRQTVFGEAVFRALDHDVAAILRHISIAYSGVYSHAEVRVVEIGPASATFVYRELYGLRDNIVAVGALEGVFDLCGVEGDVWVDPHSAGAGEVYVEWDAG